MIRYLQRKDINDTLWDNCIAHAVNGLPYGYTWYLDIVAGDWDALVLDDYKAVFPLPHRHKWGIHYLYPPFFAQQLGIFFLTPLTPEITGKMLNAIPARFSFIEMNLNYANYCEHGDFQLLPRLNLELKLDKPYDETKENYSHNLKRNLQKAGKQRLRPVKGISAVEAVDFFKKEAGAHIENIRERDYQMIASLAETLVSKSLGDIYSVNSAEGETLAIALFIHSHNRIINSLHASSEAGRVLGATVFLLDEIIKRNQGSGKIFDFEGSMIPGIARFYRSFGAEELHYWQLHRKKVPWYIQLFKR